jgi:NAD(P)-dependent dehydrogenase (short-subunit alcohol dehydrogenase family)
MGRLDGKVSLITGGASGLGRAAALAFAQEGAVAALADSNESGGQEVCKQIRQNGGESLALAVDVTSSAQVDRMVETCLKEFGRIDVLLHCAGIARGKNQWANGRWRPIEELEESDWDSIIDVNLKGTFLVNRRVGIQMIEQKAGSIVNVASMSGVVANRGVLGHGAYCASKAGVIGLTRVLATEWARYNIRVNTISPAYMDTGMVERLKSIPGLYQTQLDMTPMGRYGKPEEFAQTALFLASEESSYITGCNLLLDGGYTAW